MKLKSRRGQIYWSLYHPKPTRASGNSSQGLVASSYGTQSHYRQINKCEIETNTASQKGLYPSIKPCRGTVCIYRYFEASLWCSLFHREIDSGLTPPWTANSATRLKSDHKPKLPPTFRARPDCNFPNPLQNETRR